MAMGGFMPRTPVKRTLLIVAAAAAVSALSVPANVSAAARYAAGPRAIAGAGSAPEIH